MSVSASGRIGPKKFNRSSLKAKAALLAAGLVALQAGRAFATGQSGTWIDATTGGTWSNTANWQGNLVAGGNNATGISQPDPTTGNTAIANLNTLTLGGAMTVHLDSSQAITTLNLGDVGNAYGWTIDNNNVSTNTLTFQSNTYHGTLAAGTMPSINVANQTNTISAKMSVGGNGYQYTQWGLTGNGTLNLTNSADNWGGGIIMTGGTAASPLTLNLNLSSGTTVGSLVTSSDYYGHNQVDIGQASTDYVVLNINSGTVDGSQVTIGSSSGGYATVNVGSGGALNAGGELGLDFQDQSSNAGSEILNVNGGSVGVQNSSNISAGGYYGHALTINETAGLIALYSDAGSTRGGGGAWYNLGSTQTLNLSGGTFSVPQLVMLGSGGGRGAGNTIINLNGGTLQATGSGNFVSNFNYSGSGAFSGAGSGAVGTVNLNVLAGGGTIDTYGGSVTMNTPLLHGGSASPDGGINLNDSVSSSGALTLYNGANTYTGPTTITKGNLVLQSGSTISSSNAINVGPNGTLNLSAVSPFTTLSTQPITGAGAITGTVNALAGSITAGFGGVGGTLSFSGPLTLSGAGTAFDLVSTSAGANGQIAANGGLNITAATTVDAIFSVLPISSQTYTLFTYSGAALTTAEQNDLTLSLAGGAAGYVSSQFALNYSSGQVNLIYTPSSGASANLIWASTSSHLWDVSTSTNWTNGSSGSIANSMFHQGDNVTFDDTNGVQTAITLNSTVQPSSVTDTGNNNNFTITGTGKITGITNLILSGNSTLTLATSNDFTGSTFITNSGTIVAVNTAGSATGVTGVTIGTNGTLKIGDNATAGAGIITGAITDNGSLVMNRPDTSTLPTGITGSGSLTQAGSGTTIIGAQPGYAGATNISAGTIQYGVANALPYNTALTLSGTGTLNVNGYGQTFNNVVTSSTGTNINLGGGNVTLNTTSPDILAGPITGTSGSSIYLTGTASATVSNSVSIGTLALANNNVDNVSLNVGNGANIAVTTLNVANGATNAGTGVINQTGGLVNAGTVNLGGTSTVTNNAVATYNLSGGALNVSTGITTAQSQNSKAFINISGTGAINMLGNSTILFGQYYGEPTTVNQTGGSVSFANGSTGGIQVNGEGIYTWNLSGGTLSVPRITWGGQAANNTYGVAKPVLNFNGGTLQTSAANSAFFPANVIVGGTPYAYWTTTVTTGGAIIDTDGNAVTFINNMAHDSNLGSTADGGLTLNDSASTPGVLTLSGSNSYTGNTTITRGTLAIGATGTINASPIIYVEANGNFNVSAQSGYSPASSQILCGVGTVTGLANLTSGTIQGGINGSAGALTFNTPLTLNGGISLFDLGATGAAAHDILIAGGGLNVSGGSVIDAAFSAVPASTQTYLLFNYSGAALSSTAQGLLTVSATGSVGGVTAHNLSLSFTTGSTDQVLLTFTPGSGLAANLIWSSTSSTAWDTSSVNWHNGLTDGSPTTTFFSGDNVTFDDSPGVKTAITLNVAATPGSVTISSNTSNYSFSGVGGISGSTGLNKTGTSTLTLATNNGYTGATNLSGGTTTALNTAGYATGVTSTTIASGATFNIGNGTTAGAGNATGVITNNGTLNINRPDTFTFPASVSGNAFNQIGAGTTILSGTSTYSGNTNIQAGVLQLGVNNALPAGTNVTVTNVAGAGFAMGSYTQTIGDLNGVANNTLALGTGQLTISGNDTMEFDGPVTSGAGSALYLTNGGTLTLTNNVSAGTLSVGPLDPDTATLNIGPGNVTVTNLWIADGAGNVGGTGQINQIGGIVTATNVVLANQSDSPGNANATYDLNGGALNVSGGILMSNSDYTSSQLTISSGAQLNMLGNSSITLGNYYGEPANITQNGGTVTFANGSTGGIQVNGGGVYVYALNGGELSIPRITWGGQAGSGYAFANANCTFQFNGGTLQVTTSGAFFPGTISANNSHWSATVGSGGATVDTDGNAVVFTPNLTSAASPDGGLTKIGLGSLTLAGVDTYNGGTNVSAGTLVLAGSASYPSGTRLTIASGAQVTLSNHGANSTTVAVISTLTNTGTIDLVNNALDLQSNTFTSVSAQIAAAYHGGTWTGNSAGGIITSSLAAGDNTHLTAVGVATGLTGFEGNTVPNTDVLVKYTYYGDANVDGKVDGSDYSLIDSTFLTESTSHTNISGWDNGDFNYDNVVNGSDYTLIDNAFNSQGGQFAAEIASPTAEIAGGSGSSSVPEPTTLGLLGIGAAGLLGRRESRRRNSTRLVRAR